jgi:hypothetical protein
MIAPDSKTGKSPASRSTIAGIRPFGLIAVKGAAFLLPRRQIDGMELVRQAQLFERDADLPAVRRGGGVEIDHALGPPDQ